MNKSHDRTAIWDKESNKWDIADRLKYQWATNKNSPMSPQYEELTDALNWIIQYETNRLPNG